MTITIEGEDKQVTKTFDDIPPVDGKKDMVRQVVFSGCVSGAWHTEVRARSTYQGKSWKTDVIRTWPAVIDCED